MSTLRIVAWNIKTGNKQAPAAIKSLIAECDPHVVALSEAYSLHLPAGFCGCDVRQESIPASRRTPWFHEPVSECGEQIALFAPGVRVLRDRVVPMTRTWVAPVHGNLHEPRRHRRSRIKVDGQVWRLSLEHWPTGGLGGRNGPGVTETKDRANSWLALGLRAPSVVVGDLNVDTRDLTGLTRHSVAGNGPDNVIVRGASVRREVLGNYGSDHKAVLYTLTR